MQIREAKWRSALCSEDYWRVLQQIGLWFNFFGLLFCFSLPVLCYLRVVLFSGMHWSLSNSLGGFKQRLVVIKLFSGLKNVINILFKDNSLLLFTRLQALERSLIIENGETSSVVQDIKLKVDSFKEKLEVSCEHVWNCSYSEFFIIWSYTRTILKLFMG